ncbi:MAG: type II toxin-antitoxin system RelE/ParE family toxin [Candidatus Saganbacteria bacterium]|nr:type II toxin-antitoxin system RelE/ParE family toxin [Candidatus Saganbacteria bacterium]
MYGVVVERKAAKEIESLPAEAIQRITDAIESLKANPRPRGVKKLSGEDGWRIRIGDYRILYTIDDGQRLVAVYRVKHRREVYR